MYEVFDSALRENRPLIFKQGPSIQLSGYFYPFSWQMLHDSAIRSVYMRWCLVIRYQSSPVCMYKFIVRDFAYVFYIMQFTTLSTSIEYELSDISSLFTCARFVTRSQCFVILVSLVLNAYRDFECFSL